MSRTTPTRPARVAAYSLAIGLVLVCGTLLVAHGIHEWGWVLLAIAVTLAAGRLHGKLSAYATVSPDDVPLAATVLLLEPRFAMVVGIVAGVCAHARFGLVSRALNVVAITLPAALAGVFFALTTSALDIASPLAAPIVWFVIALATLSIMSLTHYGLHTAWSHAAFRAPFFRDVVPPLLWSDAVGGGLVVALVEMSFYLTGFALALPIVVAGFGFVAIWMFIRSSQRQMEAVEHRDALHSAIFVSLARILEMRDPDTAIHSARVARYSRAIAAELDLPLEKQSLIHLAGLLHDVGKVGIPDGILLKEGRLSDDERLQMERHARLSAEALAGLPGFGDLARMVYAHHERLDGSGYPEGIGGDAVPLGARILGVADTYEAITAHRPYREARSSETAMQILEEEDHLFDPEVVDALRRILQRNASVLQRKGNALGDFADEWSQAGRHLGSHLDDDPFVVPPERILSRDVRTTVATTETPVAVRLASASPSEGAEA